MVLYHASSREDLARILADGIRVPPKSDDSAPSILAFEDFDRAAGFGMDAFGPSFAIVEIRGEHRTQSYEEMTREKPHAPAVPGARFIRSSIPPDCLAEAAA